MAKIRNKFLYKAAKRQKRKEIKKVNMENAHSYRTIVILMSLGNTYYI